MNVINESELIGKWIVDRGEVVGDETEKRIWDLIEKRFKKLGERECGWAVLYQDPVDDSYWELTFPQGELQGGGPARLVKLTPEQASTAYQSPRIRAS